MKEIMGISFKPHILTDRDIFNEEHGILNYRELWKKDFPWYFCEPNMTKITDL